MFCLEFYDEVLLKTDNLFEEEYSLFMGVLLMKFDGCYFLLVLNFKERAAEEVNKIRYSFEI